MARGKVISVTVLKAEGGVSVLAVRSRANALLARHPLRAADAGQLGAALLVQEQLAGPLTFVCRDSRLLAAADVEGLRLPA